jgi:TRAP-type C4-dicarboxylate transport system substrate-binding protein
MLCNAERYRSWPQDVRDAIDAAAAEATAHQHRLAAAEDAQMMAKFDPAKNEIITLTPEEHAAFVAAAQPVLDKHRGTLDPKLFEYLR